MMDITPEMLESCLRTLQAAADDPSLLADNERFKALVAKVHTKGRKSTRKNRVATEQAADRALTAQAGIVRAIAPVQAIAPVETAEYQRARSCYICKANYRTADSFYHRLCPACAALNHAKRTQRADLTGRTALVTGGRIKIGYQLVLKLLRDGAKVIATTRFPTDALRRFQAEPDCREWFDRLSLHALDLRNLPAVADLSTFATRTFGCDGFRFSGLVVTRGSGLVSTFFGFRSSGFVVTRGSGFCFGFRSSMRVVKVSQNFVGASPGLHKGSNWFVRTPMPPANSVPFPSLRTLPSSRRLAIRRRLRCRARSRHDSICEPGPTHVA